MTTSAESQQLYDELLAACSTDEIAAVRTVTRYQPMAGEGAKVYPPTYPDPKEKRSGYLYEKRIVAGRDEPVQAALLDGYASQANRLEAALEQAVRRGTIAMPLLDLRIDVNGRALRLTSLRAPHRCADAAWRDSLLDGMPFYETPLGRNLRLANVENARPLVELYPTAAGLGFWYSRPNDSADTVINRNNAKVARAYTSEIVAIDVEEGSRPASRLDPLGIPAVDVYAEADGDSWTADPEAAAGGPAKPQSFGKKKKASAVGHSNIAPSIELGGVTMAYAEGRSTLSFPRLRMLEFPSSDGELSDPGADAAARALVASLILVGDRLSRHATSLRSGCDLVATETVSEWVAADGTASVAEVSSSTAIGCFELAVAKAVGAGFSWNTEPIRLQPSARLVGLIEKGDSAAVVADDGEG